MTMIYKDECLELGLPEPKNGEKQTHYVTRAMLNGVKLDTRMARYIGIGNLHSIVSHLNSREISFSIDHRRAKCPKTGEIPPYSVDVIWMDNEDIDEYWGG